jgi:hypothetical protein
MEDMRIIEQDRSSEWRPWEPPLWLVTLGLFVALLVGLIVSGQVQDPRIGAQPSPTPCIPTSVAQVRGTSYVWTFCP